MSKADTFFDAMNLYYKYREEICFLISQVMKLTLLDDMWHQITFDLSDNSFELHNVHVNVTLSIEQCNEIMNLGFKEWWLNFTDGVEKHYYLKDNNITCTTRSRDDSMSVVKKPEGENKT